MEDIFHIIKNIIVKRTNIKDVDLFTRIDQYPFDDLDRVMIEMGIEDCFHIDLIKHDEQLKEVQTVYDLIELIKKITWLCLDICYINVVTKKQQHKE